MWVYKGNALKSRLSLDPNLAIWLDYWLFLHSEETHSLWSSRALGVRAIAHAALESNVTGEILRRQLKREVAAVIPLIPCLTQVPPPPSDIVPDDASQWGARWLDWFKHIGSEVDHHSIVHDLVGSLSAALAGADFVKAHYFSRRLAAELGEEDWSQRQLFRAAATNLCTSNQYSFLDLSQRDLADVLHAILVAPPVSRYSVTVGIVPVRISIRILKQLPDQSILVLSGSEGESKTLHGVTSEVDAVHVNQATAIVRESARELVDILRLRFGLLTHLTGVAQVKDGEANEMNVPHPHPFWAKKSGRRALPGIPDKFDLVVAQLPESIRPRWYAARWHLSQAFASWYEDGHAAAAKVWQALEAFSPGRSMLKSWKKVQPLAEQYLSIAPIGIAEFLAVQLNLQARELKPIVGPSDWYHWNASSMAVTTWLRRVFNRQSDNYFRNWRQPPAPQVAFEEQVGLVQTIARRIRNPQTEQWMERRTFGDLALLYLLRNRAVHDGVRILSKRMALYLAQAGAEIIFSLMAAAANEIRQHESAPNLGAALDG